MEALSLCLNALVEKHSECDNENEMIHKFNAVWQDPKLIIQQYPHTPDWSGEQVSEIVSLKGFCDRNREQVKQIVIAYVYAILGSTFLKSILTVSPPGSEFPACMSPWVQVSLHLTE